MSLSRRRILASAAGLAAAPAALLSRPAAAQSGSIVVGTWGGDGAETLRRVVDEPLSRRTGLEVVQEISTGDPRLTKLLVERTSRRGTYDVAHLSDADLQVIAAQGILENVPDSAVPRKSKVLAKLQSPVAVPFVHSFRAIVYNESRVSAPPTSYADLWDKRWQGKVGVADPFALSVIESAALAGGGGVSDYEPAKKMLLEWRKMGVRIYPSHEAVAAALKSGEIHATIGLASRAVFWKRAGVPVRFVLPKEGATLLVFYASVPKNARNKEGGWSYLDAMLLPEAQTGLARTMCCLPVTSDVPVPAELGDTMALTDKDRASLITSDFAYVQKVRTEYLDFWNKEFRA